MTVLRDLAPAPAQPSVQEAAVAEYLLDHPLENSSERMGRHAAIRGMMVRLGLYDGFDSAIDRALASDAQP